MILAGIDPSLRNFGLAKGACDISTGSFEPSDLLLIETASDDKNKKSVRKNSDDLRRSRELYAGMTNFLLGVDLAFVEIPVGSQTARAMTSYGICIGLLASINVPLIQVTPSEVKVAATGNKNATKKEMIEWAVNSYPSAPWLTHKRNNHFKITDKNEHLADAVAAIHAGAKTDTFKQLIAFQRKIA